MTLHFILLFVMKLSDFCFHNFVYPYKYFWTWTFYFISKFFHYFLSRTNTSSRMKRNIRFANHMVLGIRIFCHIFFIETLAIAYSFDVDPLYCYYFSSNSFLLILFFNEITKDVFFDGVLFVCSNFDLKMFLKLYFYFYFSFDFCEITKSY